MDAIFINQFKSIKPKNRLDQKTLNQWILEIHQKSERQKGTDASFLEKTFSRYAVNENQIRQRFFECSDANQDLSAEPEIYFVDNTSANGTGPTERAVFFTHHAFEIFKKIYETPNSYFYPQHLIHVTCTGYSSPSAAHIWTECHGRRHFWRESKDCQKVRQNKIGYLSNCRCLISALSESIFRCRDSYGFSRAC